MAATLATTAIPTSHVDAAQMNTFRSYVTMLGDPSAKDEIKLKAAQELSENFELITQCSGFQAFLDHSMKIFIKILQEGDPHFISEYNIQQVSLNEFEKLIDSYYAKQSYCLFTFLSFFKGTKINSRNDSSLANVGNTSSICE